ncbi:MAG TPA: hypothetical protein VIY27_03960 [Myxococcota bacterium]
MNRTRETGAEPGRPEGGADSAAPSVGEALARARRHARAAAGEGVQALRALLDAASLATTGVPAEAQRLLAVASVALEDLATAIGGEGREAEASLGRALADALDAEIARWEARARDDDTEARAVLRAFLGVRELLWELGMRPTGGDEARGAAGARKARKVERVPVQG